MTHKESDAGMVVQRNVCDLLPLDGYWIDSTPAETEHNGTAVADMQRMPSPAAHTRVALSPLSFIEEASAEDELEWVRG